MAMSKGKHVGSSRTNYSPSAMSEMSEDDFKRFLDRAEGIEPLPETVETAPETSVAAETVEAAPACDEGFSEPEQGAVAEMEVADDIDADDGVDPKIYLRRYSHPKGDPERLRALGEMFPRAREKSARVHRVEDQHLTSWEETKRLQARNRKRRQRERDAKAKIKAAEKTADQLLAELDTELVPDPLPGPVSRQYKRRLDALHKATAALRVSKSLEKLRGRECEIVEFWVVLQAARKKFGERASDADVARLHPDKSMNKRGAQNRREIIARLEQPGGPWCGIA
jgi:hypothetical protein